MEDTKPTFEEAKEETYSRFKKRCSRLQADFLREKNRTVCALCEESCSDGEKTFRGLRYLVEELVLASVNRCNDNVDVLMCLLSPYWSSFHLMEFSTKSKRVKRIVQEMARSKEKIRGILKEK